MACSMRSLRMLRSACGMPGGTVRVMLLSWRGTRGALARALGRPLICDSAWASTSASMKVISELRE